MKNSILKYISLTVTAFAVASCVSLDEIPVSGETENTFWTRDYAAFQALNSCYQYISSADEVGFNEAMSDNAYTSALDKTQAIGNGSLSTDDGWVHSVWNTRYAGIRACNELTDNIHKVPGLSDALRTRYIGEAKVLRALCYYELMVRFGDVPYFTKTISVPEAKKMSRTPKATVLSGILAELDEVINGNMLPPSYSGDDVGRITSWAAKAMKARVLLSQNDFATLEAVTKDIIDNGPYDLYPSYSGLFEVAHENNEEVIIDIQYSYPLRGHTLPMALTPPSMRGLGYLTPLQELVDDYIMLNGKGKDEANSGYVAATPYLNRDPRLKATVIYNGNDYNGTPINTVSGEDKAYETSGGQTRTGYYTRKLYDSNYTPGTNSSGMNIIYLRYADILLMYAEAMAAQDKMDAEVWNKTIKKIRTRAGFTDAGALDFPGKNNILDIVRRERRAELAMEGLRYTDIIRWNLGTTLLDGKCHGAPDGGSGVLYEPDGRRIVETRKFEAGKNELWPVPFYEFNMNRNLLPNNPGW